MPETVLHPCRVAVLWIDWYPYHVARLRGLLSAPALAGRTQGIEFVGGIGVHAGLKFREDLPQDLAVETLLPGVSWAQANKLKLALMVWRRLSALQPEVVLVPGYYTLPALAAAAWARLHGAASVLMTESTAGDHQRLEWKERLKGWGLRLLFQWAVAGGRAHRDYLQQLGFPAERVAGFYDVVDNSFFREGVQPLRAGSPAAFGLPPSRYFLYVGRLAAEKNVSTLVRSWLRYRDEGGTWPLALVGDGAEAGALKAMAAASRYADDVLFPGLQSSHALLPWYAFAGCFVLPSTREPWGLVVNEAMASGLPVLVSEACGCGPDLVTAGLNGFLFSPTDASSLTGLLHAMECITPEQRERMGQRSAEIVAGYSPERFGLAVAAIANSAATGKALQPVTGGVR